MNPFSFAVMMIAGMFSLNALAQVEKEEKVVDIVYLQKGVIIGEIQHVDQQSGVLNIKDVNGRIYVLQSNEYRYYLEDQSLKKRNKKEIVIHPRKENASLFFAETGIHYASISHDFIPDDFFINAPHGYGMFTPLLRIGLGKVVNTRNEFSGFIQFAGSNGSGHMPGAGMRYARTYNKTSSNLMLTLPIELSVSRYRFPVSYDINDTIFDGNGGWQYPRYAESETKVNSLGLSVGHGIGKALKKGRSILWEVRIYQNLSLSHNNEAVEGNTANSGYMMNGIQSSIRFSW